MTPLLDHAPDPMNVSWRTSVAAFHAAWRGPLAYLHAGEARLAAAARRWLPRGGRETVKTTFCKRSLKVFGALGRRVPHLMPARSTRSSAFKIFLERSAKSTARSYS